MALTQITEKGIKDGEIVNADINASAAIAKSKIETFVNNNADNRVITGSGTANTLEGETNFTIDSNGDVLIGTSSWSYKKPLNVQGSTGSILALSNYDTTTYAADTNTSIEFRLNTGNTGNQNGSCEIRAFKENGTNGNNARGLSFHTAGNGGSPAERLRILSGGGITFNGDTAAANALDDYEEGSWTPGNNDMSVTVHYARYTRIGRFVHIVADVEFASSPADSSQVGYLTGLPFVNENQSVHQNLPWFGTSSVNSNQFFNTWFTPLIFANDDKFSFLDSRYGTYLTRATLASKKIRINSTYCTNT